MAQFDIKSLTAIGANDLARALNGERIIWDYMQASTDYFSNDVANLTTLTNVIKNLRIISAKQVADGQFDVTSRISSTDVNEQTTIRTYGLFAHFNAETPALVAIISDTNGDVLYPVSQATNPQDLQQTMSLVFPNPDGKPIPYLISSSGYAMDTEVLHIANDETATGTKTFQKIKISDTKFPSLVQTDGHNITLDSGNSEIVPADDSKVVHTTGDETIDGQKKFDTDPTDGAGNAYAKTVDVNQQLDKKVNVADMRKPASDVAGIEEVNVKQDKIGYTPADDSKVAHLSGANNFDTVPTVDNNPLLLASSLPSDLARTGQDQEFTGKNTFDTAPIDKTTGNPYITKDGVPAVPSTLADTTKLANFTDGLQSGGKDVATTDQLPVINDTGWVKPTFLPAGWKSYTGGIRVLNNVLYVHFFVILTNNNEAPQIVYPDIATVLKGYGTDYKLPDDFQYMGLPGYGSYNKPCVWINYSFNGISSGKRGIVIQLSVSSSGPQWSGVDFSIPLDIVKSS